MIRLGDKVKIIKLNSANYSSLAKVIGQTGTVVGKTSGIYKYRVEVGEIVYGFTEDELVKVEDDGADPNLTIRDIAIDIAELVEKKNHDYNNSFDKTLEEYGDTTYFLRIEDKLSRLKSLTTNEAKVTDESAIDTLKDIVGYTLLMLKNKLSK